MRVAVITPYHSEEHPILRRCAQSVQNQDATGIKHIFVADGNPHPCMKTFPWADHMILPVTHADAGATPRAIGALSAFSLGYDAVAFLDADNTYQPNHISSMVSIMERSGATVVTATRNICTESGENLYVDRIESTGENFCDTNCMFLGRSAMHLLTYWITEPAKRLWSDRRFWSAIIGSNITRAHCTDPTVNYHSRWAWHYQHAGRTPPDDSVWISIGDDGTLTHQRHVST